MNRFLKSISLLTVLSIFGLASHAQLVTNNTVTPEGAIDILLGQGIEITNLEFSGDNNQIGSFECNNCGISMESGIILATGDVVVAEGPNDSGSSSEGGGNNNATDPDLETIQENLNDAAVLEFDFVATGDSVQFNYVWASEEYPEFVPEDGVGGINDVFGFFLSGPGINGPYQNNAENIAEIPGTDLAVSIANLNNGPDAEGPCMNCEFYIDNLDNPDPNTIQFDGFTVNLTALASGLQCGETYHIKIAIADASDTVWDSGVFLEAESFESNATFIEGSGSLNPEDPEILGDTTLVEGCNAGVFNITRADNSMIDTVYFDILGDATNGVDYTELPPFVVFDSGQYTVQLPVEAFEDDLDEDFENIILQYVYENTCGDLDTTSSSMTIVDVDITYPEFTVADDTLICPNIPIEIIPDITFGVGTYDFDWSTGDSTETIEVLPQADSLYYLQVTDICGSVTIDSFSVHVPEFVPLISSPTNFNLTCPGFPIDISADAEGGSPAYQYSWPDEVSGSGETVTVNPEEDTSYEVLIIDQCDDSTSTTVSVEVAQHPPLESTGGEYELYCYGDSVEAVIEVEGGLPGYTFSGWPNNENSSSSFVSIHPDSTSFDYPITVIDSCDTETTSIVTVVNPNYDPNISASGDTICAGTMGMIGDISGGQGNYTFTSETEAITVEQDGSFTTSSEFSGAGMISIEDECGNFGIIEIVVESCDTSIPNIITPNGDSKNDVFQIKGLESFPGSYLHIKNRWGVTVFETSDYKNDWDGTTSSGEDVKEGTYFYIFQRSDGVEYSGYLQISR